MCKFGNNANNTTWRKLLDPRQAKVTNSVTLNLKLALKNSLPVMIMPIGWKEFSTKAYMIRLHSGGSRISRRGGGRGPRRRGCGLLRRLHFENFVCQNKRIGTLRGGRAPGRAPLDPPMLHNAKKKPVQFETTESHVVIEWEFDRLDPWVWSTGSLTLMCLSYWQSHRRC